MLIATTTAALHATLFVHSCQVVVLPLVAGGSVAVDICISEFRVGVLFTGVSGHLAAPAQPHALTLRTPPLPSSSTMFENLPFLNLHASDPLSRLLTRACACACPSHPQVHPRNISLSVGECLEFKRWVGGGCVRGPLLPFVCRCGGVGWWPLV